MSSCVKILLWVFALICGVLGCGQKITTDFDLIQKQPTIQSGNKRLLLGKFTHPLKMYGHYINNLNEQVNMSVIQTLFGIATSYYSRVIKVFRLHHNDTFYPEIQAKCGSVQVPREYQVNGFDENQIDMVLFVEVKNQLTDYVAAAAPCVMVRRPIYGIILFNMQYVDKYQTSGQFHNYLMVTIHQIAHVLAMRPQLFQNFYVSPTSNVRKTVSQVIRNISSRSYIITPKVKSYVQKYFGCKQDIGALLEEEGGEGSMLRHWERKVFMDDIMTASNLVQGLRLTELTLNLISDSNFYASVDTQASDKAFWGKDKGCQFAQGLDNSNPEYERQMNVQKCDYYHKFSGYSSNIDQFGSKAIYTWPFLNMLCGYPSDEPFEAIALGYYHKKSINGRCFQILYSKDTNHYLSVCYEAHCNSQGIQITVGKQQGMCKNQSQTVEINGISIRCPSDFEAFCGHKSCPQWCNRKGLCLNGKCICTPPFFGEKCSQRCINYYQLDTNTCVNNCRPNQVLFQNTTCLNVCPYLFQNKDGQCHPKQLTSQSQLYLTEIKLLLTILSIFLL